jgi:RNA polymerase sigma-70 factor (ECF subfamily)
MNDARDRTDEQLARAAKRGDAAAYDALARRYLRPAMALAWQYTGGVEDAEDVVQEAFHRAVRGLGTYDDQRPFSAWFYAIVRNVARTAIRKDGQRAVLAPLTLVEELPARAENDPVLAGDVERAIDQLAPMQQACVRLCNMEGFTSIEAARMLGVSEGTVRTHLFRARNRLREDMRPQEDSQRGELS